MSSILILASLAQGLYGAVLLLTGLFLICLILLQRGRGGGLAGAFGGMGGQSAFGSKAGDTFTHVTIVIASVWIVICILGSFLGSNQEEEYFPTEAPASGSEVTGTTPDSGGTEGGTNSDNDPAAAEGEAPAASSEAGSPSSGSADQNPQTPSAAADSSAPEGATETAPEATPESAPK